MSMPQDIIAKMKAMGREIVTPDGTVLKPTPDNPAEMSEEDIAAMDETERNEYFRTRRLKHTGDEFDNLTEPASSEFIDDGRGGLSRVKPAAPKTEPEPFNYESVVDGPQFMPPQPTLRQTGTKPIPKGETLQSSRFILVAEIDCMADVEQLTDILNTVLPMLATVIDFKLLTIK